VRCVGINPFAWSTNLRVRQAPYVTCRTSPTVLFACRNAEHITHPCEFVACVIATLSSDQQTGREPRTCLAMPCQMTASTKQAPVAPGPASLLLQGDRPTTVCRMVRTWTARLNTVSPPSLSDRFDALLTPSAPSSLHSYDMEPWVWFLGRTKKSSQELHGTTGT
jgi:hypothetical protein